MKAAPPRVRRRPVDDRIYAMRLVAPAVICAHLSRVEDQQAEDEDRAGNCLGKTGRGRCDEDERGRGEVLSTLRPAVSSSHRRAGRRYEA